MLNFMRQVLCSPFLLVISESLGVLPLSVVFYCWSFFLLVLPSYTITAFPLLRAFVQCNPLVIFLESP